MATQAWDVASRLSEGRPAVQNTQTYVAACQVLGYQHPELTAHAAQVCDWYDTEAGLDLHALDDDRAALWAAVTTSEEALAAQRGQLAELAVAWRGPGADCAVRFVQRHCDAAAAVVAQLRAAGEECAELRDTLWQLIDDKVATAIAIDDRRQAERPVWLAAARAVLAGAADRSAREVIHQQVIPYVDNDIRIDWLTAMRATVASVDAAFDAATDGLAALPDGCFEVVGDFGPSAPPVTAPAPVPPAEAVLSVPAATAPPPPPPPPPAPAPPSAAVPPPTAPLGDALGMPGGIGDFGGASGLGGLGGLTGGIGGVVGSIVDGIGGLLGSLANGLGDPGSDDSAFDDPFEDPFDDPFDDDAAEAGEKDADPADIGDEEAALPDESPTTTTDIMDDPAAPEQDTEPPAAPVSESSPPAPPREPTPPAETPCEIAADELPQAGQ